MNVYRIEDLPRSDRYSVEKVYTPEELAAASFVAEARYGSGRGDLRELFGVEPRTDERYDPVFWYVVIPKKK